MSKQVNLPYSLAHGRGKEIFSRVARVQRVSREIFPAQCRQRRLPHIFIKKERRER